MSFLWTTFWSPKELPGGGGNTRYHNLPGEWNIFAITVTGMAGGHPTGGGTLDEEGNWITGMAGGPRQANFVTGEPAPPVYSTHQDLYRTFNF